MQPNAELDAGQRIVRGVAVQMILISVIVIATFVWVRGTERLPQQTIRFLLTCALAYSLSRGTAWARWVCVVLYALGGIGTLVAALASTRETFPVELFALGSTFLVVSGLLVFPASVRAFYSHAARPAGPER